MPNDATMELVRSGQLKGPPQVSTHYGVEGEPGEGPWVEIWLTVQEGRIDSASYRTHGCPSSQASSVMLCRIVTGRSIEEAGRLTSDDLLLIVGGLPEGKGHFAEMAVRALRAAMVEEVAG